MGVGVVGAGVVGCEMLVSEFALKSVEMKKQRLSRDIGVALLPIAGFGISCTVSNLLGGPPLWYLACYVTYCKAGIPRLMSMRWSYHLVKLALAVTASSINDVG